MSNLASRMKRYESVTDALLVPFTPVMVRLDGRAFHTLTKSMRRPYDDTFGTLMIETTRYLVREFDAVLGYTQSDEISILLKQKDIKSELLFSGRVLKLASVLASATSAYFSRHMSKGDRYGHFDARPFNLPNDTEVFNCLLWRQRDATRNSLLMTGQAHFSHKELWGKNTTEVHDMLFHRGVNWNDFPEHFKRGAFVKSEVVRRKFAPDELENLPELHEARSNPDYEIARTVTQVISLPPLTQLSKEQVEWLLK